ncbi:orf11 [Lactococcus cremoris subsp. cremoris A76]|nr:putative transcriptional regulator [Lactococcus cremoris]AEU39692.1 orf11 [Lactococcus cremoris subsp. cremoris A76]
MEQVVTHYRETIQQHSVEWYKKQLLKDFSVQFMVLLQSFPKNLF